jgi:hypothetical protein
MINLDLYWLRLFLVRVLACTSKAKTLVTLEHSYFWMLSICLSRDKTYKVMSIFIILFLCRLNITVLSCCCSLRNRHCYKFTSSVSRSELKLKQNCKCFLELSKCLLTYFICDAAIIANLTVCWSSLCSFTTLAEVPSLLHFSDRQESC